MGDMEDYLTSYREFFKHFAATVNPDDQLPVTIAGYSVTDEELPGEVLYWTTQYLTEKKCPETLMTPLLRIILDDVRTASKKQPSEFGYLNDEAVYTALRLMQAATARVNDICLQYLDNAKLDTLPPPSPPEVRGLKTVSIAVKNSRRAMEDRHVEIGNLEALFGIQTSTPTRFYAVYDGHAGSAAATYCAAHLHQYLVESPYFSKDLTKALEEAFLKTDDEFVKKTKIERCCGGSTAVVIVIRGSKLHTAWAGDSLAFMAKRLRLMQLVHPHKPSRDDEKDRIEESGGQVMFYGTWRVNGQLAVSRAIGDAQYKPYVTAQPEIKDVDLDGDEDFVVIACDGLWDFVSEDIVTVAIYKQLAENSDDLKAIPNQLVVLAKKHHSSDNISIIVVFLKDPRLIAADNCLPMDFGLENPLANGPPFAVEADTCKRQLDIAAATDDDNNDLADMDSTPDINNGLKNGVDHVIDHAMDNGTDNGIDHSDSDSEEDLGPETAVDADDIDADARNTFAPTPPAHTVEGNQVENVLVDNVAESGEESEDEWNYFKGEGDVEDKNPVEELPNSETPCQDNSQDSSSADMNTSPLNPDAPVFVPGTVAGTDVLLAESPRKPLLMDDIEVPDVKQFQTEAEDRPADLVDLDNCDQLNGHHNISMESSKLNENEKENIDSFGFGFNVSDSDKKKDLLQDFERIQKDTTDFCNIQVFQTHAESNPFSSDDTDELLERLKNKERDPMSMSFYQEKDSDTCERLGALSPKVDLNAVQTLPESDDEDLETNIVSTEEDKENVNPHHKDLLDDNVEPNNDIVRLEDRTETIETNLVSNETADLLDNLCNSNNEFSNIDFEPSNIPQTVVSTDTPESHKLLFEQIPEIPDGKSSELGFSNDDMIDPSENEIEAEQEVSQNMDVDTKEPLGVDDTPHREIETEQNFLQDNDIVREPTPVESSDFEPVENGLLTSAPEDFNRVSENIQVDIHQFDLVEGENEVLENEEPEIDIRLGSDIVEQESSVNIESDFLQVNPVDIPLPTDLTPAKSSASVRSPSPAVPLSPSPALPLSPSPALPLSPSPALPLSPSPTPAQCPVLEPVRSPSPTPVISASPILALSTSPVPVPPTALSPEPVQSTLPEERLSSPVFDSVLDSNTISAEANATAPDVVPEHRELVTDLDAPPEQHAPEICLAVTDELPDDSCSTPAVAADEPLQPTPIAADALQPEAAALGVAAAALATAGVAAALKSTTPAKKPTATSKATTPAAKSATPITKSTASKPSTPRAPSATKAPSARTPVSKAPATARTTPTAAKPAAKVPSAISKTTATTTASRPTATTAAKAAPRPAPLASKPAAAKPAAGLSKPTSAAAKPAPRPAARSAPAPAAARPAAPKPAPARAPAKPLANGDVKPIAARRPPVSAPAPRVTAPVTARPAPRPTASARPATAPATTARSIAAPKATTRTLSAAAKPASATADKQSKELANKRLTSTRPPIRSTTAKAAPVPKAPSVPKAVPKKLNLIKKDTTETSVLSNGDALAKSPPTPAQDNALLPDVIA